MNKDTNNKTSANEGKAAANPHAPNARQPSPPPTASEAPALSFWAADQHFEFSQPEELDAAAASQIVEVCTTSGQTPLFAVTDLLSWTDQEREVLFGIFRELDGNYRIRLGRRDEHATLFEAVLEILEGPSNPSRCGRGLKAIVQAAQLQYSDDPVPAASAIFNRFKELGVKGLLPQSLRKQIKNAGSEAEDSEGNPLALAELYLEDLRANEESDDSTPLLRYFQSDFYRWNGRIWQRIADGEQLAAITRFVQGCPKAATVTRKLLADVRVNLEGLCMVPGWTHNRFPLWISETDEVTPSPYLAFENGLMNLAEVLASKGQTPEVHAITPQHFSPVVLPYAFDAGAKCPQWLKVLGQVLPKTEAGDQRISLLQEAFGWCLLTGSQHLNLERFFILKGRGANGKSTVLKILEAVLGQENVSHVALEAFDGDFKLYEMTGKLANVSFDMNRPERVAEGVLKAVVSGEPVQVNRKYKDPTTLYPTAKLFFATNELPSFGDRTDGLWRRAVIVPFEVQIPAKDRDISLLDRLSTELPGILNWALDGARRLMEKRQFTECSVCNRTRNDHREATDLFLNFAKNCVEWASASRFCLTDDIAELYSAYKNYGEHDLGMKPTSKPKFTQRLQEYVAEHATEGRGGTKRVLKLKEEFRRLARTAH